LQEPNIIYIHIMVEKALLILASVAGMILLLYAVFSKTKKKIKTGDPFPENYRLILQEYVDFYNELEDDRKLQFENRLRHFLATTKITGVNTDVEDVDKVLVGASAIIPIFGFTDWEYINLKDVLLYPDAFNEKFNQEGDDRTTLGIVGEGPYQNMMILSKHELRQGFINKTGKNNTAIHEFVHLIDKTDGAVDGVPEFLLSKKYVLPWLNLIQENIQEIRQSKSDINPYGATNQAEFFAVVSEYFFERPDLLQENHPELYEMLNKIFRQQPHTEIR
jgi:Mlc titration factor MtfA (ptsG expression regulator)